MDPAPAKIDHRTCSPTVVAAARRFYEAYLANSDGLAWNGQPCPTWEALNDAVKSHWCAVAIAAGGGTIDPVHPLNAALLASGEPLALSFVVERMPGDLIRPVNAGLARTEAP